MDDLSRLLAEQRIGEYGMRLRRLDERLGHAEKKLIESPDEAEIGVQLERLKEERDRLAAWLDETRRTPIGNWRKNDIGRSGPMGVWDAIAQQVEKLVERIEH